MSASHHPAQRPPAAPHEEPWLVACLCAQWCGTCRDFRAGFEQLAAKHPDKHFRWIDIEDEAELVDDFDVENFPTVLIQRGASVLFYGTILPNAAIVDRQLSALSAARARAIAGVPDLLARLTAI